MGTIKQFEDLEIWQMARKVCKRIYEILESKKDFRDFGLKTQVYNSSGSIMDNTAEGFERNGRKEFIQFLSYAKGSAGELRSQLYRLSDKEVLTQDEFNEIYTDVKNLSGKISNFINYLKNTEYKGIKFSEPEMEYLSVTNLEL